jgi:hypothetical protein
MPHIKFARSVFLIASIYGVLILVPGFFTERLLGELAPPPLNHPEFYYGFYGAALSWQIVYFLISRDPVRYRPLMLVGFLAKLSFFGTCLVLYFIGRLPPNEVLYGSLVDGVLMGLFLVAYLRMDRTSAARTAS